MSLVFAGVCSHAPGITGREDRAPKDLRDGLYAGFDLMRAELEAAHPDVLMIVAAEHFANFFMNNMPSFAIGMGDYYDGPIESVDWLRIPKRRAKGDKGVSLSMIREVMQTVDIAYCEEWQLDHGIMVPLHFLDPENRLILIPANINCQGPPLTPLHRAWAFGEAIRRAADAIPQRVAVIGTGGISHWPATPDSGRIDEAWDRDFLDRWSRNDKKALLSYSDETVHAVAGQGGFEIRTFIATAAAAGGRGKVGFYAPIPIFAVGCTTATMEIT
jgi:aromatic ring-opening dioxygenase catalytic subunit (LigB family)